MVGESQANKFTDKLFSLYDDYLNMVVQSEKKRKREVALRSLSQTNKDCRSIDFKMLISMSETSIELEFHCLFKFVLPFEGL